LHDDDLIDQDFIEKCLNEANYRPDFGLIRTGVRKINSNGNITIERKNRVKDGSSVEDLFLDWFADRTAIYFCNTLFNADKLREIGGLRSKKNLFEDVMAVAKLAAKFERIDVQDVKASFRNHPYQTTYVTQIKSWCEDSINLLNTICKLASEKKQLLRTTGLEYFANRNFKLASKITSRFHRYVAYFIVYKTFEYQSKYIAMGIKQKTQKIFKFKK
jgi:hypothetical protein